MNPFADTNWLEALYFPPETRDREASARHAIVERRMRKVSGPLLTSQIVVLEARNAFGRTSGSANPPEWERFVGDFNRRVIIEPMNWDLLRQETNRVFERFSHKATIGTFDATLIASAQMAGAHEILSFDEGLKVLARAIGLDVFPELTPSGRARLAQLKK